jgi:heme-degrading monooxygenase HmoA
MYLTVFRARLRPGIDMAELGRLGERMYALATAMPGFVSYKDFTSEDGESVTLVEFASEAELLAWRNHAEHREAQERGRREFFTEYSIQVCQPQRAYRFSLAEGRVPAL